MAHEGSTTTRQVDPGPSRPTTVWPLAHATSFAAQKDLGSGDEQSFIWCSRRSASAPSSSYLPRCTHVRACSHSACVAVTALTPGVPNMFAPFVSTHLVVSFSLGHHTCRVHWETCTLVSRIAPTCLGRPESRFCVPMASHPKCQKGTPRSQSSFVRDTKCKHPAAVWGKPQEVAFSSGNRPSVGLRSMAKRAGPSPCHAGAARNLDRIARFLPRGVCTSMFVNKHLNTPWLATMSAEGGWVGTGSHLATFLPRAVLVPRRDRCARDHGTGSAGSWMQ